MDHEFGEIGAYHVIGLLGEGARGTVSLAEQRGAISRKMAVKVLKSQIVSNKNIRGFNPERQILAGMNPGNIAGIFDAGTNC